MKCLKENCGRVVKKNTNYCVDHQLEDDWVMRRMPDFKDQGHGYGSGERKERDVSHEDEKKERWGGTIDTRRAWPNRGKKNRGDL